MPAAPQINRATGFAKKRTAKRTTGIHTREFVRAVRVAAARITADRPRR